MDVRHMFYIILVDVFSRSEGSESPHVSVRTGWASSQYFPFVCQLGTLDARASAFFRLMVTHLTQLCLDFLRRGSLPVSQSWSYPLTLDHFGRLYHR